MTVRDAKYPFERRGDDLLMEVEISLLEALVRFCVGGGGRASTPALQRCCCLYSACASVRLF